MGAIKRTQADIWFSRCVRTAANWTCARCFKQYPENSSSVECAHFMTRGKWATRFDPNNVACLCTGCHFYLDSRPYEKAVWFETYLTPEVAVIIREKSENTKHGLKKVQKEIAKHYKAELTRLRQAVLDGVPGSRVIGYL